MNRALLLFVMAVVLASPASFAQDPPHDIFEDVCPDWAQMTDTADKDIKRSLQEYIDMLQMFIDQLPTKARINLQMIEGDIHARCVSVAALPAEERALYAPDIQKMNDLFKELLSRQNEFANPQETPYARDRKK